MHHKSLWCAKGLALGEHGGCGCNSMRLVARQRSPAGAYKSSGSHTDYLQKPVLIRDEKVKWLDFGSTPDPVNLQPHAGYVWLKSGYSEAIPWRKVRLTKQ